MSEIKLLIIPDVHGRSFWKKPVNYVLENNKDVHRLFEFDFQLPAFTLADLTELTLQLLKEKYNADIADDLLPKLNAHFAWYMRQKDLGHTNGHLAEKVAEDLYVKAKYRGSKTVEAQDIDISECFIPRTEEQILAELDDYIGLQSVKDEIRAIVKNVKNAKQVIEKAFRNQIEGKGFSLIEVVSACPTNWGMTPQKALQWVEENMIP